jgi:hypothetical protein
MLDIQSISTVIAATSVVVGVVFAVLQLRGLVKTRQTDILVGIYSAYLSNKENWESWEKVRDRKATSYSDYKKKYGFVEVNQICSLYEQVGVLLKRKLVDINLVQDLFGEDVERVWKMFKPIIYGSRKTMKTMHWGKSFEYLYNEMKKREQTLQAQQ